MSNLAQLSQMAAALRRPVGAAPWRNAPETAQYIHAKGSLQVPDADGSTNTITSFLVQQGFACVIEAVLFQFAGETPPQEGNAAAILYGIRVDGVYFPRDFLNISTSLGSLEHGPYPVPGGLRFEGGQRVEGVVTVPAGSPISTGPGNFVICHLLGYQWPDR